MVVAGHCAPLFVRAASVRIAVWKFGAVWDCGCGIAGWWSFDGIRDRGWYLFEYLALAGEKRRERCGWQDGVCFSRELRHAARMILKMLTLDRSWRRCERFCWCAEQEGKTRDGFAFKLGRYLVKPRLRPNSVTSAQH
jgi:hypothetical protein